MSASAAVSVKSAAMVAGVFCQHLSSKKRRQVLSELRARALLLDPPQVSGVVWFNEKRDADAWRSCRQRGRELRALADLIEELAA